ncbi:MAG: hypothetical protein DWQ49_11730 [Bacteroidetes bacterium]|nr:MAG: hypothetical protein DWQ49_11730 [Bacteroidota bacterium]
MAASTEVRNKFEEILEAARTQGRQNQAATMVVLSHLQQMTLLMIKKGLSFYCDQDTFKSRTRFLHDVIELNRLDIRFPAIIRNFLIDGCGLFYFRPDQKLKYQIYFFNKNQYRVYHDVNGQIEEVVIIYDYKVKNATLGLPSDVYGQNKRYVRLSITADTIQETESDSELSFEVEPGAGISGTKSRPNSLGFVPAVECLNKPNASGTDGEGDFDPFMEQIVLHNDMITNIAKNIEFFGNPTLISSRPRSDLVEAGDAGSSFRPTISSQSGFAGRDTPSTRVSEPFGSAMGGGLRVPRIIANVEPSDRVGYMTPDPISGDMNRYALLLREEIRTALGGVDEISISAGATATEIKGLMGRAQATALRKNKSFLTYGFCRLLEMMVYHQEMIFRESFIAASGLKEPNPPKEETEESILKYQKALRRFDMKLDEEIKKAVSENKVPRGVVGLPEDGDRSVSYRFMGDVYEDTAFDLQQKSIVVRNMQEVGVNSVEAIKYLFPDKTEAERAEMLKGFPFRMVGQTQSAMQQFLVLLNQMLQSPHPLAPDQPLAADPRLNITPLLYRTFDHLAEELTYSGSYEPADPSFDPEPGLPGGSPGGIQRPGLDNRLPAMGGTRSYPGGSFGSYSPSATAGGTGFGPFYQQPVQPVNVAILPEQPLGSSDGFPGAGDQQSAFAVPQPGSTVTTDPGSAAGYNTSESAFTGPALGLPGAAGSADLAYQRLTDPGFLADFYGQQARTQRRQRRGR